MKRIKGLMSILLAIVAVCVFAKDAEAKDELYVTDWIVEAEIMENGDLKITEDITYEFNNKFNGVYRDIILNKVSGIADISVQELSDGKASLFTAVDKAKNGDSGIYTIEESKEKVLIKIFSPSQNETKTFRISYIAKNVAVKYNDTAELYYQFLGNTNETAIGRMLINIYLPDGASYENVHVFAHGPLHGKIIKADDRHYQLKVDDVPAKTFIEGRVLFPVQLIALSDNIVEEDRYLSILEEEETFQSKLEKNRARKETVHKVLNIINPIAVAIGALALIYAAGKCKRNAFQNPNQLVFDWEKDCTPAMAALITNHFIGPNVIFASLLDLFRKGYIGISRQQDGTGALDNQAFIINKQKEADKLLQKHEKYLMEWLFFRIGHGKQVSTKDIENYSKNNNDKFIKEYSEWKNSIKADVLEKGCYDRSKRGLGVFLIVFSVTEFILGIFTAANGNAIFFISIIMGVILAIYGIRLFGWLSDYGYELYRKLINIKSHVKYHSDFSDIDKNVPDQSLIYALALNTLAVKPRVYEGDESLYINNWIYWYFIYASDKNNSLRKSMDTSFAPVAHSGDSGSFSGGGGAGAGGGGTGGF